MKRVTFEDLWHSMSSGTSSKPRPKPKGSKAVVAFERTGHRHRIGGELSVLRTRLGLSQTPLAKTAGVDQAEISRIERGLSNATEDTLARLAKALGAELTIVQRTRAVA